MLLVLCVMCYGDLVLLMLWVRLGWSELFQTAWEARHFYTGHCVRKKAGSCRPLLRVTRNWKRDLDLIALYYRFNVFNVDSTRFSTVLCSLTRARDNLSRPFWSRKLPTQKLQGEAGVGPLALRHRVAHDRHVELLTTLRCGSLRLEGANLKECGLVHGAFTVLRRASLTRHSEKCRSLGVVGSPLAWLLTLRLACSSVYVLGAALPLLSLLELLMKPMDQRGDGFAITVIRAQSIKVLDLDQEALVKIAARGLAIGESSTTSCGQLITSELPHSSLPLGRRPTQARQWGHACFNIIIYILGLCRSNP